MSKKNSISLFFIFIFILCITAGFALTAGHGGIQLGKVSTFAWCVIFIFIIQWLVFIPSFVYQTEKYYDLTGSITFISVTVFAFFSSQAFHLRAIVVMLLVLLWALRLGVFLFQRVNKFGKDQRFDELKTSFMRYLITWTMQGLWITFTLASALVIITNIFANTLDLYFFVGITIWLIGFIFEIVADDQKRRFKNKAENKGKFISTGLWRVSRHPNYFGEILLWFGIFIIAIPILQGPQWIVVLSPVFVIVLLTKISGIPILEKQADKRWGEEKEYQEYKNQTPVLFPKLK